MSLVTNDPLLHAAARAAVALVGWRDASRRLQAHALVPLVAGRRLVFALPYTEAALADALAAAPGAAVVVMSDPRLAPPFASVAGRGRVTVAADPRGERFEAELLAQQLRKHPPSRVLLDSPLLRREHWWYLPRLLVGLEPDATWPVEPLGGDTGTLLWDEAGGLAAATVAVDGWDRDDVTLRGSGDVPDAAEALLVSHDFAVPDRERTATLLLRGAVSGGRLSVIERVGERHLPRPPGLLARIRRQRDLERRCRSALVTTDPLHNRQPPS